MDFEKLNWNIQYILVESLNQEEADVASAWQVSLSVNVPLFDALNMFKDFPEAVQGAIAAIMSPVVVSHVTLPVVLARFPC